MKLFSLSLSALLLLCFSLTGQDKTDYQPPTNVHNGSDNLPNQVDLIWTPPSGWIPSPVDRWYDYDRGIYGGNAIGSCPGCPVEVAIRWEANHFELYDSLYISKIRYVIRESALDHALRVYQVENELFDTLLNYPLEEDLVYYVFDTMEFAPIPLDISKELWVGLWVSDLGPGFPLAVGNSPVINGYGNMVKIYDYGYWQTLMELNPDFDWPWNIGAYLETPNDSIIYPVFNVYRAIDDQPFEKIHEGYCFDTVYHDYINNLEPDKLHYYVTCVYEDGESMPSDTLHVSLVNTPEIVQHNKIKVFPNPATDRVMIESGNGKIKSLSLINNEGEEILNKITDSERVELDISKIPGSFYILKTITSDGVFTSKLLIVK
jgi:hypothetical protein